MTKPRPFRKTAISFGWPIAAVLTCLMFCQPVRAAERTAVLDRVVAVVGDQAILASDVDAEMRFAAFQPGAEPAADNTPQRALNRVLDRTLIDEQRALQPGLAEIPPKQVAQQIAAMRKTIPDCVHSHCETEAGWQAFIASHGFSQQEVEDRVHERLAILKFINLRFGVATRVPNSDARKYYDYVLKPQLDKEHAAVPEYTVVAARIREIIRQQQVSALLDQWLESLRNEDHVRILDSAYGTGEAGQ